MSLNFDELKKMAGELGGVLVFDEQGQGWVVLSWTNYQKIRDQRMREEIKLSRHQSNLKATNAFSGNHIDQRKSRSSLVTPEEERREQEVIDRLNQDIETLKEEIKRRELAELEG